jgi:hypothetical protein
VKFFILFFKINLFIFFTIFIVWGLKKKIQHNRAPCTCARSTLSKNNNLIDTSTTKMTIYISLNEHDRLDKRLSVKMTKVISMYFENELSKKKKSIISIVQSSQLILFFYPNVTWIHSRTLPRYSFSTP